MHVLTKQEFEVAVLEGIQKEFPNAKAVIRDVVKTNNVSYRGLSFEKEISAIVNLDDFYDMVCTQDSIADTVAKIKEIFLEHGEGPSGIDISAIGNYEEIKDNLALYVMNAEPNLELIKEQDLVTLPYMDLVLGITIFYPEAGASIKVPNSLARKWGVPTDELFVQARNNTDSMYRFESMANVLCQLICDEDDFEKNCQDLSVAKNGSMHVLTNRYKFLGAANIANMDLLGKIAEQIGEDYYILPSSIHELIIVKSQNVDNEIEQFKEMVQEVNDTQLASAEILSYSVYKYCISTKSVLKVA